MRFSIPAVCLLVAALHPIVPLAQSTAGCSVGGTITSTQTPLPGVVVPDAPQPDNGAEAWILFRASGTEPLLRLYAEAATPELVEDLLAAGEKFVLAS